MRMKGSLFYLKAVIGASVLCMFALTALQAQKPAGAQRGFFPLSAGTYWIYKGTVQWEATEGDKPGSTEVTWKMTVEKVIRKQDVIAAVVTGFPADLDWTGGTTEPKPWLILENEKHEVYYENLGPDYDLGKLNGDEHAFDKFAVEDNFFFQWPLRRGAKFCGENAKKREDGFYCWNVAEAGKKKLDNVTGVTADEKEVFRMEYRTLPDDEELELVPGLGILSYRYHHHGTVADTDLRLVEFHSAQESSDAQGHEP